MKPVYIITVFLLALLATGKSMAQVRLPVDASNCAIFNALNPGNSHYCMQAASLGPARGLIIRMESPEAAQAGQQTAVTQLLDQNASVAVIKRPNTVKIDYRAAKSESGYYIHFAFDSESLGQEYRDHLNRLAIVLNSAAMKENCVKIIGHTDTVGDTQYNLGLSRRRAVTVYNYLIAIDGTDKNRFTIEAKGESQPLPDKSGISPYNRRVEFLSKIVANGCMPQS